MVPFYGRMNLPVKPSYSYTRSPCVNIPNKSGAATERQGDSNQYAPYAGAGDFGHNKYTGEFEILLQTNFVG